MAGPEGIDEREVELRMALLREWYGDRFAQPEQEQEVRAQVANEMLRACAELKRFKPAASDEPWPPFVPYRGDDR